MNNPPVSEEVDSRPKVPPRRDRGLSGLRAITSAEITGGLQSKIDKIWDAF